MKKQIESIIDNLIINTENKNLKWEEKNPSDDSRSYKRTMISHGEDKTKYEMEIRYFLSGDSWKIFKPDMQILSTKIPGGMIIVNGASYSTLEDLRNCIKNIYCNDLDPKIEIVENILEDINKNISLQTYRDNKLNSIL
jgi:hypothetical protein